MIESETTNLPPGLRRIGDAMSPPCPHPQHNPPTGITLEPGMYQHTCPGCGHTLTFVVPDAGSIRKAGQGN